MNHTLFMLCELALTIKLVLVKFTSYYSVNQLQILQYFLKKIIIVSTTTVILQ